MAFSNRTHRKYVGILAALATCFAIIAPTASAIPADHPNGVSVSTESTLPSYQGLESPTTVVVRFDGLPAGAVGADAIGRPAPADNIAAQAPTYPTMDQLEKFAFDRPIAVPVGQAYAESLESIERYVPGGLAAQVEADNWQAIYGVPAEVPEFSTDGPRTAPDALVRPTEQLPVAEPGFDWTDAGIGIAIGTIAGLMLGAALLLGRRRNTLAGA